MSAAADARIGFACSACGKCCNTAPLMRVAELFQHQDLFVGCLTLARRPRDLEPASGLRFDTGGPWHLQLGTQALEPPSTPHCPALRADGLCSLHGQGKPAMCATVPLDPALPDAAQAGLLRQRAAGGRDYIGADCIDVGATGGKPLLIAGGRIVDAGYHAALQAHRRALTEERQRWGEPVFAQLWRELDATRLPAAGFVSLPLLPVLLHLAGASSRTRGRCLDYARGQVLLLDRRIALALERRDARDRATTQEFRRYQQAYRGLIAALEAAPAPVPMPEATEIERYLGLPEQVGSARAD